MGTKVAVAFAKYSYGKNRKPNTKKQWSQTTRMGSLYWLYRIFLGCNEIEQFVQKGNQFHPTIKFMAEISDNQETFLDNNL